MQDTNLNLQPYFDDYDSSKNFYRVLFKPNYPIQARELTTLQSILQGQIEKFGKHVFKEGSIVIPGQVGYDIQYQAVLVQSTVNNTSFETIRPNLTGKTLVGEISGVKAKVLNSISATTSEKSTPTLYVKYVGSGNVVNGVQLTKFTTGEVLRDENNNAVAVTATQNATSFVGSAAYITTGVFFIRGFFVEVPEQNIILDQYNNFSSYKIGLSIVETIVTTDEDKSLYDNAVGSPNFAAPGADRLKIEAILSKQDIDAPTDSSFIELLRLEDGKLIKLVENTVYNQFEKNLARRTFDESGNYTVSDFNINVKETYNDGQNNGVYSTSNTLIDGTKVLNRTPVDTDGKAIDGRNYYTVELSPIKAYVKGFEINNSIKKYVTVEKPRKSSAINNQGLVSAFGNYIELDTTTIQGSILPGNAITLKKTVNNVETSIGKAVALSLIVGGKLYLADISMFTVITTSENSPSLAAGDFIFANNGASAVIDSITGSTLVLRQVTGVISQGATFTNSKNTLTYTISTVSTNNIENITNLSSSNFNANVKLEQVLISGSSFNVAGSTLTGIRTRYSSEVQVPMKLLIGTSTVTVTNVTSSTITFSGSVAAGTYYGIKKLVPKVKTSGLNFFSKISNDSVKSTTDFSYFKAITETKLVSNSLVTISTTSNFTISPTDIIITNNSGSVQFTATATSSTSVNISVSSALNGTNVNVTYKVRVNNPSLKTKSASKFNFLLVDKAKSSSNTIYGTRFVDKDISLKFSDVYKVHAIRQALTSVASTQDLFDRVNINDSTGLLIGDIIEYQNIRAKIISISGNTLYILYMLSNKFENGSNLTLSVDIISSTPVTGKFITSVTNGNYIDITNDFILNKNDGPEFYNISKLTRLANSPVPQNKFVVVFDYFIHNNTSNDFYTTNSYNTSEISYSEIPVSYDGTSYSDIVDFRFETVPSSGSGGTLANPYQESISAFDVLSLTRIISTFAFPGEIINLDYDYYLGRIDKIFLDENGNVIVSKGSDSTIPTEPEDIPNALHIGTLTISPYMKSVNDSSLEIVKSKNYTMKDIGSIDKRLQTVEELTSLNLLEIGTNSLTIVDEDGNNRFKTGFVADNFKTTDLADLNNVAYTACIDTEKAILRPYPYVTNIQLKPSNTGTTTKQTGSLVTLPYTETPFVVQSYASRVENLQPFEVIQWYGDITLRPEKDVWFDTVRTQAQTQRIDLSQPIRFLFDNSSARGEQWGAWTTTGAAGTGGGINLFQQRTGVNNTFSTLTQEIQVGDSINSITATEFIRSRIVELLATKLKPDTLFHFFVDDRLNNSMIFPKNITGMTSRSGAFVTGEIVEFNSIPNNRNNPIRATVVTSTLGTYTSTTTFLSINNITTRDGTEINPDSLSNSIEIRGLTSGATGIVQFNGPRVKSDSRGTVDAFLIIPPNTYQTGETVFKLCDQITGTSIYGISDSSAEATYDTLGTRVSLTSNVVSLTTAQVTSTAIRGTQTVFIPDPPPPPPAPAGRDPVAQSFLVDIEGGIFATSIDLYFQAKDNTLPVSIEIRTMENGTLTNIVVPNSIATVQSPDVKISNNGSVATKFVFPSPIYLNQNTEYAFIVRSASKNYKIWISRLSEVDVLGGFIIDKQPYSGSLYKSQNMSVWTPDQFEDLKFTLNRAKFATGTTYTCKLVNSPVSDVTLPANALKFTQSSGSIEVYHPNHGMNSIQNYVTISSVLSDAPVTSLNTNITTATQTGTISVGSASGNTWTTVGEAPVSNNNPGYILINNEIIKYTAITGNTLTIPSDGRGQFGTTASAHPSGSTLYCYSINGVPLSEINKTHKIAEVIDLDRYKISSGVNANSNVVSGGSGIKASRNIQYEELYPNLNILSIPSTNVSVGFESVTANSPYQTGSSFITISEQSAQNRQYNELNVSRLIASPANSNQYFGSSTSPTLTFNVNLSTEKDNISPAIDVDGSSAIAISNRIIKKVLNGVSDLSAELTPSSGIYSSYITKKITLQNTSTSIKVLLDGIRSQGLNGDYSDIKVFIKTSSEGNLGTFDSMNYIEVPAVSYPRSANTKEYKAFDFELKNLAEFKEFAIKVCMISGDQTNVPKIRNFRAIALAV